MDSASASVFYNVDNTNFDTTLLPVLRPVYEQQGITIKDGGVIFSESNYGVAFLGIELWLDYDGVEVYQVLIMVPINETCFTQITCTTLYGESDDFIGVIAYSIRYINQD